MAPTHSKPLSKPLNVPTKDYDDEGLVPIDTWVQAPTPTTAGPHTPSMVTWARGMTTEEAEGVIEASQALLTHDATFYDGRENAAKAVVRAYQVLHREVEVPEAILKVLGGVIPTLKAVHYYSLSQIVRSGPEAVRMALAIENHTGRPYVAQYAGGFLASYTVNGKPYRPSASVHTALDKAHFVSGPNSSNARGGAAAVGTRKAGTVGGANAVGAGAAALVATPPVRTDTGLSTPTATAKRPRVSPSEGKTTDSARDAVEKYIQRCKDAGEPVDQKMLTLLYEIPDKAE